MRSGNKIALELRRRDVNSAPVEMMKHFSVERGVASFRGREIAHRLRRTEKREHAAKTCDAHRQSLFDGDGKATAWGCDLTYDYVKINGDYRT